MSLRQEQSAFALDLMKLELWLYENGYEWTLGESQRPIEMQKIYMQTGRSKTMNSMHIKKCAQDLFIFKNGKLLMSKHELQAVGDKWESLSPKNSWGGNWNRFKDVPHFERKA